MSSTRKKLYRVQTDFDFTGLWRWMMLVSAAATVVSVVVISIWGLNLSIDFKGGAVWEVPSKHISSDQAEQVLESFDKLGGAKIQRITDAEGTSILRVQATAAKDISESNEIRQALADAANSSAPDDAQIDVTDIGTNTIGPSWGKSITRDAVRALIVFFIVIAGYMAWTLEWRMAVSGLLAVAHDVLITVGIYAIARFEVTPATVISILTILGFSLYDTIVVYDRVRENAAKYDPSGKYTYNAIKRRSLNQVIMRSVNTSMVAILPPLAIFIVGGLMFGQPTMMDFSLALIIGLAIGVYSSIGVAAPMLVWLKEREPAYSRVRSRARARGIEAEADHIPKVDSWEVGVVPEGATRRRETAKVGAVERSVDQAATTAELAQKYDRAVPPRPRKQGKKR
ncbi:MAG TPA: protein translocase subunit SecF [Microthrixaceae bacterium]|nr:protein translocase subunit SecF [Microthrixaceae bacterium]